MPAMPFNADPPDPRPRRAGWLARVLRSRSRPQAPRLSRRGFLDLLWKGALGFSGVLAAGGLLRFLDYQTEPPAQTVFDVGLVQDFPPGSRTALPEAQAVLINTPGGLVALSTVCPHLGCQVELKADGFQCPCHGSRFDPQGRLVRGPATRGMRLLRVEQTDDGHLVVHTD